MRLDSVRELKQQLLADVVAPITAVASGLRARAATVAAMDATALAGMRFAVGAKARDTVPDLQRSVALGVARHTAGYRLAIRVQRQALLASPLVERLVRQAKGEADVRLIGRIDKRARRRTPAASAVPWYRANTRPLLIGSSIGHVDVTAGTLGAFIKRGSRILMLSNNHVLANEDEAKIGDVVLQRAQYDGGRAPRDRVGTLAASVRLKTRGANFVDAALASIDAGLEHDPALLRSLVNGRDRKLAGPGRDFLDEGVTVYKTGRTTGATKGRVTAFDVDNVVVNYDMGNLRFDAQVEIEGTGNAPFSDGGDSGALIVDDDMLAVALLFAGGETGGSNGLGLTYANPIHRVLADTKATLLW
ncbi:MAG TPA: hypothetical protein VFQ62_17465 [Methylomirabilota bacterium]|nr:hypothetical protein [Methylomirabilota bacterium]